jgi:hypothetical protein
MGSLEEYGVLLDTGTKNAVNSTLSLCSGSKEPGIKGNFKQGKPKD